LVAVLLQQFGRSHMLRRERNAKIRDAVHTRQQAGKDRNVRSVRDRAMGEGLGKPDTVGGTSRFG
jgi:hypothetical protein